MCFSLGIKLLGAGPGTALVMSLLVVIGTLLPLIEDHVDNATSPAALVTILGLIFAIAGFVASAKSSSMKARSFTTSKQKEHGQQQAQGGSSSIGQTQEQLTSSNTVAAMIEAVPRGEDIPKDILASTSKTSVMEWETQSTNTGGSKGAERSAMLENGSPCAEARAVSSGRPKEFSDGNIEEGGDTETSHLVAVAVCVAGAVMSSMLQFAFVYGDPLIADAEDDKGLSGAAAPLVIWLLAFSLQGLFNVGYSCYLLWANNTWGRYKWEGYFELSIKFLKVTVMSIFFFAHIHLYGVAQYFFGDLGPVVAWPLLMSSTVLSGQLWSIFMKEWVGVTKLAVNVNILSMCLIISAVIIIAIAGAVL
ncbi:unnamed protein product [Ascophyllum nodosum]